MVALVLVFGNHNSRSKVSCMNNEQFYNACIHHFFLLSLRKLSWIIIFCVFLCVLFWRTESIWFEMFNYFYCISKQRTPQSMRMILKQILIRAPTIPFPSINYTVSLLFFIKGEKKRILINWICTWNNGCCDHAGYHTIFVCIIICSRHHINLSSSLHVSINIYEFVIGIVHTNVVMLTHDEINVYINTIRKDCCRCCCSAFFFGFD